MPRVAVLVPRRAGIADRDALWSFARKWWEHDHPDWAIVEGEHEFGPFNRSAAINRAAELAGDVEAFVIIDADVLADAAATCAAVDLAVASGRMVLGYHERVHLSERGTRKVLEGYRGNWKAPGMVATTYTNACSSLVVVSRELFETVHGFDERFVGWGWEDVAFRVACETLGGGSMASISSTLWHLYHRTSHENNAREPTFQANRARGEQYKAAHYDRAAVLRLLNDEPADVGPIELDPPRIPRVLHRTVPAITSDQVEAWWDHWQQLHPGWDLRTWRDPLDPADFPLTSDLWELCTNGAQLAGLVRLELLWTHGGVYVDSDVEPYRSLEPLVHCRGFAGWEDDRCVPDAVLGAEPEHPAVEVMLAKARVAIEEGGDAWASGPGVTTSTLPQRRDWLLLPPGSFYPYHYTDPAGRGRDHSQTQPWAFCAHHWAGSWLTPAQRRQNERQAARGGAGATLRPQRVR